MFKKQVVSNPNVVLKNNFSNQKKEEEKFLRSLPKAKAFIQRKILIVEINHCDKKNQVDKIVKNVNNVFVV